MNVSISEAQRRLPELVRLVRRNPSASVQITVHGDVVAELRAALPTRAPGAAAKALLELTRKLPRRGRRTTSVSSRVKEHLYKHDGRS